MEELSTLRCVELFLVTVTLDEVARFSGVSRAAASRALNGRDGVRPDVRARVERAAASLGYRVNRAAKNLASGRSSVIGLLMPINDLADDPHSAALLQGVANAANRHDEGLMLMLSHSEPNRAVTDTVRDGLIDGLIVSTVALGKSWVDELLDTKLPRVLIGAHNGLTDVHAVDVENHDAVVDLVAHLHEQGCRRIGHIQGPQSREDARQRSRGFRTGLERLGLPFDEALVAPGNPLADMGYSSMVTLIAQGVDAVVVTYDQSAEGAIRAIRDAGLTVPHDVAIVGFDGTSHAHDPPITSAVQPLDAMCDLAVVTLLALVDGQSAPMRQTVPAPMLIAASSLRTAPTTSATDVTCCRESLRGRRIARCVTGTVRRRPLGAIVAKMARVGVHECSRSSDSVPTPRIAGSCMSAGDGRACANSARVEQH